MLSLQFSYYNFFFFFLQQVPCHVERVEAHGAQASVAPAAELGTHASVAAAAEAHGAQASVAPAVELGAQASLAPAADSDYNCFVCFVFLSHVICLL